MNKTTWVNNQKKKNHHQAHKYSTTLLYSAFYSICPFT